jgi:hypothetical protein
MPCAGIGPGQLHGRLPAAIKWQAGRRHSAFPTYFFGVKRILAFALGCWLLPLLATAQQAGRQPYWQQQADYQLQVRLNDTTHALDGEVRILYTNNSPDTLRFLWIHLWPNAYKNDRTAFAEQTLLEDDNRFYFSKPADRGYINRINFSADGQLATVEDHPRHIDIVKLLLPRPLPPGRQVALHTPFHVQLPRMVSRGGHFDGFYAATQWYPKVAMYDASGWHEMPYLSAGEYYNNFGRYDVQITLPANYVVAATGQLQNAEELAWLKKHKHSAAIATAPATAKKELFKTQRSPRLTNPPSSRQTKTLRYTADSVTDFAWAADKRFAVKYDTCALADKVVDVWNFVLPEDEERWSESMRFSKRALRFYSQQLGSYAYPQVSVVASPASQTDGMEYPMLTLLNDKSGSEILLDIIIAHEIGHNWLQAVLATNERSSAWLDEGMNTFLERRYYQRYYGEVSQRNAHLKMPADGTEVLLRYLQEQRKDAPIASAADTVMPLTHYSLVYNKAANWLQQLEQKIGSKAMDSLLHQYYRQWQFRHPTEADLLALAQQQTGQSLQDYFSLLHRTGPLPTTTKPQTKPTFLFNFNETDKYRYIGVAPIAGFNQYDRTQLGLAVHNYNVPAQPLQYVLAPLYATGSQRINGYAHADYHWYPQRGRVHRVNVFAGIARFGTNSGIGQNNEKLTIGFNKLSFGSTFQLKRRHALSTIERSIDVRAFLISEEQLRFETPAPPGDTVFFAVKAGSKTIFIPQVSMRWQQTRSLYPWQVVASVQQVQQIVRASVEANFFLNYNAGEQGIAARFFAGKIFYLAERTEKLRNDHYRYHFTMYAPNGQQDYTYSNPFIDRNQSVALGGRQIAMRDGGFKYRSDFSAVIPGLKPTGTDYFDNWLAALNLDIDIPTKLNPLSVLPFKVPLKIFADLGTSSSPWQAGSTHPKFLYSIGIHVPVLKVLHIYYPVLQSKAFREPNSVNDPFRAGGPRWWTERLTFSLDLPALKKNMPIPIF